jgi:hypothetical protein
MQVDAMLCNHAEAADGKLYVNGGGIAICWVGAEAPHLIQLALGAIIRVPYTATNQPHTLTVRLLDEDGHPVVPWSPPGGDVLPPVETASQFTVGRPPQLVPGESQALPFAMQFQLAVPTPGAYAFTIEIDAETVRDLPFRAMVPPVA